MESIITIIFFALLLGILLSPILILYRLNKLKVKNKFWRFSIWGIIITASLTIILAWWGDASNEMLLSHYGYNFNTYNDTERFAKVLEENMERVKSLESSMYGIGWPLGAMMTYIFYSPVLIILYLITYYFGTKKHEKKTEMLLIKL